MNVSSFRIFFPAVLNNEIDHTEGNYYKEEDGDTDYEIECVINCIY